MRILKVLIGFTLLTSISCSKKNPTESKVKIQFDQSYFTNSSVPLAKNSASNASDNHDGPNWGLQDPTNLSQINCWGVFVGGPESSLQKSRCTNFNDNEFIQFGPRAGFFPINGEGEVFVPAGSGRKIWLAGMASANGQCELGFDTNADVNAANYSNPFIVGYTEVDLVKAEEQVAIFLQNSFIDARKLKDCDFFEDIGDDDSSDSGPLDVDFYESSRSVWVNDNPLPRTVHFTHSGESAQCSSDNGANYFDCNNGSFVWNPANYTTIHHIKAFHSDGTEEHITFNPSVEYPGLTFVTCDVNVTSATTSYSGLNSILSTANQVICFDDGYSIDTGLGSALALQDDTHLIVRQGQSATLSNSNGPVMAYTSTNPGYLKVYGLNISADNGAASEIAVSVTNGSSSSNQVIEFIDCTIETLRSGGFALKTNSSSIGSTDVKVIRTILAAESGGTALGNIGTTGPGVTIETQESFVKSNFRAVFASNGDTQIKNGSVVSGLGPNPAVIIRNNATVEVHDSQVSTKYNNAINLDCATSTKISTLVLEDSVISRKGTGASGNAINLNNQASSCTTQVQSTGNNNIFCQGSAGGPTFSGILGGTSPNGTTTFIPATNGQNSVGICPP